MITNNQSKSSGNVNGSIGFIGLLTLVFITLKLLGVIAWPWFWVLSPMIFSFVFWMVIVVIILIIAMNADK